MIELMQPALLLAAPLAPLLLLAGLISGVLRRLVWRLVPLAALPALLLSLVLPLHSSLDLPWLLFGAQLGLDQTARMFLFFTSVLWLVSGVYATGYFKDDLSKTRFYIGFLAAMAGNLGLIVAQDMAAFYSFFALMSFASYILVVHSSTPAAFRAGRIYIILVVVGEVMLFAAFAMAAQAAGSLEFEAVRSILADAGSRDRIIGLALIGFGIKAGVIGLHVWLPLAHPVAPTPASAVLSGAMIAAGLLGWVRLLPLGEAALTGWGEVFIITGAVAVFYAVLVGLMQSNPKTVLAYSSISKMGLMTIGVGLGLAEPSSWQLISNGILVFVLHHGLAKGALFLGVGIAMKPVASRWLGYLLIAGLLLPALALAGAPWTSGMLAKALLKVPVASSSWGDELQTLLTLGSVAASMLMMRFLYLVWQQYTNISVEQKAPGVMWQAWSVLLLIVALNPWFVPLADSQDRWAARAVNSAFWPVAVGGAISAMIWLLSGYRQVWKLSIPSGDIVNIVEKWLWPVLASGFSRSLLALQKARLPLLAAPHWWRRHAEWLSVLDRVENRFRQWPVAATLFLMLTLVVVLFVSQILQLAH